MMLQAERVDAWWADTYGSIVADLGLDAAADQAAALLLDRLADEADLVRLAPGDLRLSGGVVVAGGAPSLLPELARHPPDDEHLVVADAALAGVLATGHPVALVVTDLDGDPSLLARLNARGLPLAVHAHGDNVALLREWVPRLSGPVLPTRQTPAPEPGGVVTPGGFTDGDRAVFLAARLGAGRIRLAGFDLAGEPAPGTRDPERKRRKLRWAARILAEARALGVPLVP